MSKSSGGLRQPKARWAAALALALATSACTSGLDTGDSRFEARDYQAAIDEYEASLAAAAGNGSSREVCGARLFRLALAYSLPTSSAHQPERAAELLETLADQCSQSPWGETARMMLSDRMERRRLLADITVERARADALQTHLEQLADVRAAVDSARADDARSEAELTEEIGKLRRQIASLKTQIEDRDRQVAELENELRRLKDIDLQ